MGQQRAAGTGGAAAKFPVAPSALQGRLHIAGGAYQDDTGPVLPLFAHLGDGFSRYVRDPDAVRVLLDDIAEAGYHGVRVWTYLTGPYWAGREVDAGRQTDRFAAFEYELIDRGLQAVVSQGDLWQATSAVRQRMHDAIIGAFPRAAIAFLDAGNEVANNGGASPQQCAAWIEGLPGILSLSTTQSERVEDLDAWSIPPAQIFDEHGYRGGHWWDKVRHIRNIAAEHPPRHRLGIQSEPFGAGRRVSVTENIHELTDDVMAFSAAMSLAHRQAYVWFSGPGVISDESERLQDMPGFLSVPQMAARLPRDLMTYSRFIAGHASQGPDRVFGVTDEPGTTRCDGVLHDDGRFWYGIYGPNPQYRQLRPADIDEDIQIDDTKRIVIGMAR